jgi:DNA repair protein RecO
VDRQFRTKGIILSRVDFEEADRIITFLTPDHGKVSAIAKGVRKSKSKLAGGIELFSISDLSLIKGRREVDTLISTRLIKYYSNIVKDLRHTQVGYEIIKMLNRATEQAPEAEYFSLLQKAFEALDILELDASVTKLWFDMQMLKLAGHTPDLMHDISGAKLALSKGYIFHLDQMKFEPVAEGKRNYRPNHIKFLRLGFATTNPKVLAKIEDVDKQLATMAPLVQSMLQNFLRI